jgi:hypothetical protein
VIECEGRSSGHVSNNPPPADTKIVILIWVMIVSWAALSIVVIGVLMSTRSACLAPTKLPSLADWQTVYLNSILGGGGR